MFHSLPPTPAAAASESQDKDINAGLEKNVSFVTFYFFIFLLF